MILKSNTFVIALCSVTLVGMSASAAWSACGFPISNGTPSGTCCEAVGGGCQLYNVIPQTEGTAYSVTGSVQPGYFCRSGASGCSTTP